MVPVWGKLNCSVKWNGTISYESPKDRASCFPLLHGQQDAMKVSFAAGFFLQQSGVLSSWSSRT